jgi:hypothetical protein
MKKNYGLQSYAQALPNATGDLHALQINTHIHPDVTTPSSVDWVAYKSVCIQDIIKPIAFGPKEPFTSTDNLPTVQNVTLQDVHILAPTAQFPSLSRGVPTTAPNSPGSYELTSLFCSPSGRRHSSTQYCFMREPGSLAAQTFRPTEH